MRYLYILMPGLVLAILWAANAEATKPDYSCANVRCGSGTACIETPTGPICQSQLSCANVLCAQGNHCIETTAGPECRPVDYGYQNQSCAYGGYYHHGRLVCNSAPAWRNPYQNGWGHYYSPHYAPPRYTPPRPRPPWHYYGNVPEVIEPTPREPILCPMIYDPVCAEKPVVCVRAPCPAIRKTFGNDCQANAENYTVLYKGQCH